MSFQKRKGELCTGRGGSEREECGKREQAVAEVQSINGGSNRGGFQMTRSNKKSSRAEREEVGNPPPKCSL